MERLSVLQARLHSIGQLQEVVGAMRSLAAVRLQQVGEALPAARDYAAIIGAALGQALAGPPPAEPVARGGGRAVLLFGAEHGFVGGFNEALLENRGGAGPLFIVGSRAAAAAEEAGLSVAWWVGTTSHPGGAADIARMVAREVYRRFQRGDFTALDCVFGCSRPGANWAIERETLLPLDLGRFQAPSAASPPLRHLPLDELAARLIEDYFLADLARCTLESLGAENAARLLAMTAAHDNIRRKLGDLRSQERTMRQQQITEELLDVTAGAEVLMAALRK